MKIKARSLTVLAGTAVAVAALAGCSAPADTSATNTAAPSAPSSAAPSASAAPDGETRAEDEQAVADAFDGYVASMGSGDGDTMLTYMSSETVAWFEDAVELTKSGGPADIESADPIKKLLIAQTRATVPADELQQLTPGSMLASTLEGASGDQTAGEIEINGDTALVEVVRPGQTGGAPQADFVNESGKWLVNLTEDTEQARTSLEAQAETEGVSVDDLVFEQVRMVSGETVDESIWEAPAQ